MAAQERRPGSPTELYRDRPENSINYIRARIQNRESIPSNQRRLLFERTGPNKEEICDILRLNKDEFETIYDTVSENANFPCFVIGDASELYGENYKGMPIHIALVQESLASSYDIRSTFPEIQRAIQEYNCMAVINDKPLLDELCGYIVDPAESGETKTSQSGGAWPIPKWAPQIEGDVDTEEAYVDRVAEKIVSSIEDYKSNNDYLIRNQVLTHIPTIDYNIKREDRKNIIKLHIKSLLSISEKKEIERKDNLLQRFFFFYSKLKDEKAPPPKHTRIRQLIECLLFRKNFSYSETNGKSSIKDINEIDDAYTIDTIISVGSKKSSDLLKLMDSIPSEILSSQALQFGYLKTRGIKMIQSQEVMERHTNLEKQPISYKQFAGDHKYRQYNVQKFWAEGIIDEIKTVIKNPDIDEAGAKQLLSQKYEGTVVNAAYDAYKIKNTETRMALIRAYFKDKTVEENTIIKPEVYTTIPDLELLLMTGIINIIDEIIDSDQSMELYFTFMYLINKQPISFYFLYDDIQYFNYADGQASGILTEDLKKAYRTDLCYNMIMPVNNNQVKITTSIIRGSSNQLLCATKAIFTSLFEEKVALIDFGGKPEIKYQEEKDMKTTNLTVINWKYPTKNTIIPTSEGCGFIAKEDIKDESYGVYSNIQGIVDSNKRHNVMAVLSQLTYSTTAMIKTYFKRNTIVYLGSYDPDKNWYLNKCDEQIKHRIHVFYEQVEAFRFNLYIAFRGSHTGDDWHDIDKKIVEGSAVFFDKRVNAMNSMLLKIQNDLADKLNINGDTKTTYNVDTYSCGHSLGGFLALMAAFKSLYGLMQKKVTRNSGIFNLVFSKETETPKIIPVVFNPFCGTSENTMAILATIPKGFVYRIHAGKPDSVASANDYASLGLQLYKNHMQLNFINMLNTCVFIENITEDKVEDYGFITFFSNPKFHNVNYSNKSFSALSTYSHLMYNFIGKHALTMQLNELKKVFDNNYKLNSYIDYDSETPKNINDNDVEDELSPQPPALINDNDVEVSPPPPALAAAVPALNHPIGKPLHNAVASAAIKRSLAQGPRRRTYRKKRMSYKANRK